MSTFSASRYPVDAPVAASSQGPASVPPAYGADTAASDDLCDRSIGDILRQANGLTAEQVEHVLRYQRERSLRFGEAAVALGYLRGEDVMWALSQQFHYPYVSDTGELSSEVVVAKDPFSEKAEIFRSIRSQLMIRMAEKSSRGASVAILSPHKSEGKTYFAANLAVAFSQLGGRTLLVDANMRTPRLHELFNIGDAGRTGLSGILSGRATMNAIAPVPGLPSLFLLPVGIVPPNPLELVERPAFGLLMRELQSKFDHVLVDTPAAVLGTDSAVIAAACGCALTVVRAGSTSLDATRQLLKRVHMGRAELAGVVMNHI